MLIRSLRNMVSSSLPYIYTFVFLCDLNLGLVELIWNEIGLL